jgi:hypothetical protein
MGILVLRVDIDFTEPGTPLAPLMPEAIVDMALGGT